MLFFWGYLRKSHFLIYGSYIKTNIIMKLYICLYVIYDIDDTLCESIELSSSIETKYMLQELWRDEETYMYYY